MLRTFVPPNAVLMPKRLSPVRAGPPPGRSCARPTNPAIEHRKLRELFLIDDRREIRLRRFDLDRRRADDLHGFSQRPDTQRDLEICDLADGQGHASGIVPKALQLRVNDVRSGLQRRNTKDALLVGDDDAFDTGRFLSNRDCHPGQDAAGSIGHFAAKLSRLRLGPGWTDRSGSDESNDT